MGAVPEVSVAIPTSGRWRLLRRTLESALSQRHVSIEVVVADDGSSDDTYPQLRALGDRRVRVIRSDQRRGVAAARNAALGEVSGAWVAFLDDDDLWAPEKLERQIEAAEETNALFAYTAAAYVDHELKLVQVVPAPDPNDLPAALLPTNRVPAGASNVIARTDVVRRLGGFDVRLHQIADWDLWIRLAETSRGAAWNQPLVAYRMHGANMVLGRKRGLFQEIDHLFVKHADLQAREGVAIDRALYTRWIAWARRRQGRRFAACRMYLEGAARYRSPGNLPRAFGALLGDRAFELATAGRQERIEAVPASDLQWLRRFTH
jgi:glycosyltransferase involved in cell wall biosynthesis